ncbi:MAG TPA: hypothetical protein VK014_06300 [Cyclobacteriaceae bacterium]|nr:hypothetical protein [Cyclobacteriaceae bacterium]
MAELKWSNNVIEDVLEIEEYWQKVSIEYAREIVREIMEKPWEDEYLNWEILLLREIFE